MLELVRMYRGEETVLVAPWQVDSFREKGWVLTKEEAEKAKPEEEKAPPPNGTTQRRRARRQAEE